MTKTRLVKSQLLQVKTHRLEMDDGFVLIRSLSAAYAMSLKNKTMDDAAIFDLIAYSLCDEQGQPILTSEEVSQMDIAMLNAISKGIMSFNGLNDDAVAKAQEELKNSPAEGSTTS